MKHNFSIASHTDAGEVAALVNRAYRPATAMGGWTHEANLVRGPRTTEPQVAALMNNGGAILTITDPGSGLIACVHVSNAGAAACIGMLATDPAFQGIGLGTQMLEAAERYAVESGMPGTAVINVLECRSELAAFYERRGYRRTGVVHPYPVADGFGSPVVEGMTVVEMAKGIKERLNKSQAQACTLVRDGDLANQVLSKDFNLQ